MNARKYIRNLLILFALGSLGYLAVMEIADRKAAVSASSAVNVVPADISPNTKLIVYYFAEGKNCSTCASIPLYTRAALDTYFANELGSGVIVWRTVNVDEAQNAHFVTEFNLYTKSIVLIRVENGKQVRWKNLDSVWDLVYDKPAFVAYIRKEVREDLDKAP